MSRRSTPDILLRITEWRRKRVKVARMGTGTEAAAAVDAAPPLSRDDHPFLAAIAGQRGRAVIAEIKLGSPSLGSLKGRFDPLEQARLYAAYGAAALSVVVEPDFFYGSYDLLQGCKRACGLPTLAKDFVVDPIQLEWAKGAGADAVLLVSSLYTREELLTYAYRARQLGLAPLVEVHDLGDLGKLEGGRWELVGINSRDLRTFDVKVEHALALAQSLPNECLKVAESGISGHKEIRLLRAVGFDAFLVGESLLLASHPPEKLQELLL